MRKIFQYIMLAVATIVMASCTSDIEETTATTGKNNVQLVVGEFPTFGGTQTRAIGEEDPGKTSWENGDEVLVQMSNTSYGTSRATFTYNGESWELTSGELRYREGDPAYISRVYYAPNYEWVNSTLMLKKGKTDGTDEYIEGMGRITDNDTKVLVSFAEATRNYSRLRVATMANKPITVVAESFTPAGSSNAVQSETYSLTSDDNGNAFLYGNFSSNSSVTVKYNDATLVSYTFSEATKDHTSYALDATVTSLIGKSADDIYDAIKCEVESGKTNIRIILSEVIDHYSLNAIKVALEGATSDDNIDLTIMGLKKVGSYAFTSLPHVKSLKLLDVEELGEYALCSNPVLQVFEAPSLKTIHSGAFLDCPNLQTLLFGPIEYAEESKAQLFDQETTNIDLTLSRDQKELEITAASTYTPTNYEYAGSSEHNSKEFIGYTFKSITCRYRVD